MQKSGPNWRRRRFCRGTRETAGMCAKGTLDVAAKFRCDRTGRVCRRSSPASAAPFREGPASRSTLRISRRPSSVRTAARSILPRHVPPRMTSIPACCSLRALGRIDFGAVKMSRSSSAVLTSRDWCAEVRSLESRTTRSSRLRRERPLRSVSSGSSARTGADSGEQARRRRGACDELRRAILLK